MEHNHDPASTLEILGAVGMLTWTIVMWTAIAVLAYSRRRPVETWMLHGATGIVALGVVGQLGHFVEHVAQAGYWVMRPYEPAWMTPWGTGLANGFGVVDPSKPSLGMEILHFIGNMLFLAGLVGVMQLTRRVTYRSTARKHAKMGVWMQGIHGLEHLVLMTSVWLGAPTAIGLSTWFGLIDPGPALSTHRIWWHFLANVVGTVIFSLSLYHLWLERSQIAAAYRQPAPAVPRPAVLASAT
ncbi:DUF6008 family protein [Myceligenerans indicum]|uniref:Cytochrome b561 bacterial/Ni-hydrogenase domain-containing protein n=1 Tax=Myceligenerans indicum TaxID=2593663 RepID=A0ABS1LLY8_9MICO|nr:DUF6008 family protein [Myceligenerans indicum]MBL0887272.1 hypothetical protein [Myceligenerans indicum]